MEGDCFALFGRLFQSFALRYEKDFWPLVVAFSNLQISCCISKSIKAATGVSYEKSVQVLCSTSIVLVNVLLPIKLEERLLFCQTWNEDILLSAEWGSANHQQCPLVSLLTAWYSSMYKTTISPRISQGA